MEFSLLLTSICLYRVQIQLYRHDEILMKKTATARTQKVLSPMDGTSAATTATALLIWLDLVAPLHLAFLDLLLIAVVFVSAIRKISSSRWMRRNHLWLTPKCIDARQAEKWRRRQTNTQITNQCVYVCVCERQIDRQRDWEKDGERGSITEKYWVSFRSKELRRSIESDWRFPTILSIGEEPLFPLLCILSQVMCTKNKALLLIS